MLKIIKTLILTIFTYLLQATVFPLLPINNISGNIIIAMQAIIIVAMGRQHGFASSLIFGILMEVMVPSLPYLHLLIYPFLGVLGSIFFADKTDRRLEMERVTKKKYRGNINPLIRTFLCTLFLTLIFEMINIFYELLRGVSLYGNQITRAFGAVIYNVVITSIIIIPARRFYGLRSYFPRFGRNKKVEIADLDPSTGVQPILPIMSSKNNSQSYSKVLNTSTIDKDPASIASIDSDSITFQQDTDNKQFEESNKDKIMEESGE